MDKPGIVVQATTLVPDDVDDLRRFSAAQLVVDWDTPAVTQAVQVLFRAEVPVQLLRFTQDPTAFAGWPTRWRMLCPLAVFANEPELEGWPDWYEKACSQWLAAGGSLAEPAWQNEQNRLLGFKQGPYSGKPWTYDAILWHCYAGDFGNRDAVIHRAAGRPIIGGEYGHPHQQQLALQELAAAGVDELVYLFAYRWQGNADAGYDVAGVPLLEPLGAPYDLANIPPIVAVLSGGSFGSNHP